MARHIDPYSLRLFVAAARAGSIALAAASEHIAASALSRRIADLEATFGVPLLIRSPQGVTLTEAGKIAIDGSLKFDQYLQSLVREVQTQAGTVCGTLRLCATASAIVGFLPERLNVFRTTYPLVEIELQERVTDEVIRACLDGSNDVGICIAKNVSNALDSWPFAYDQLSVVLPHGHPLAKKSRLRFTDIISYPLVSILTHGALDRLLNDQAAAYHMSLKVSVSVRSFNAVCRMVEAGLGIAVIPHHGAAVAARAGSIVQRSLDEDWANRELRVYALSKKPRSRAAEALIDTLSWREPEVDS